MCKGIEVGKHGELGSTKVLQTAKQIWDWSKASLMEEWWDIGG